MSKWRLEALGELTVNLDSVRIPVKEADRRPGLYPYYGASGVVDHVDSFLFEGLHLLVAEDGENLRTRKLPIAFLADGRFWVNNHAHIVRGNDKADTRFLLYALMTSDVASYLTGSTMPKLTQGNLNRIQILTPSLDEQRVIASTLGALDNKIDLNRRTNETLESMSRALFKDWFVDFGPTRAKAERRTPYLAPDMWSLFPKRLDDDEKPEGWDISSIGQEVDVVGGSTPSTKEPAYWGDEFCWATPKDLSSLHVPVLLETERRVSKEGLSQISSGLLPVGTVLLSSRAPIGYLAVTKVPTAVNQGFIAMVCRSRLSNVFAWLWTDANMEAILRNANGSTFQEISKANFRPIPVIVPAESVVAAFNAVTEPMFERIIVNEQESRVLAQTRDFLLPRLMSGEIRIKDAEKLTEAVL